MRKSKRRKQIQRITTCEQKPKHIPPGENRRFWSACVYVGSFKYVGKQNDVYVRKQPMSDDLLLIVSGAYTIWSAPLKTWDGNVTGIAHERAEYAYMMAMVAP